MNHKGEQMKISKFFAVLFGLLGTAIGVVTVLLCLQSLDRKPMIVQTPDNAVAQLERMMNAVCENDYAGASALIYGTPDLGADPESCDPVSAVIWEAFVGSLEYSLVGDLQATDKGVSQQIHLRYMDVISLTDALQERSRTLLEKRIEEADRMEDIYDENNDFRQDFVDAVVAEAAAAAVKQDAKYLEKDLTVSLAYTNGQWWVLADEALIQVLSGGMEQ